MPSSPHVCASLPLQMFFLLLCYLWLQYGTQATPVPIREQASAQTSSTNSNRSLFNIIWSCVSTIIICTWVSVHPNVPPRSKLSALLRRIWMMFWTIIAPELVLAWAVRQWSAARMVKEEFKDRGWTVVHGHFLIMGGFTLINGQNHEEPKEPKKPKDYSRHDLGPVSFEDFKALVDASKIDFPTVTLAEIRDKSKGDLLSKIIAIIQTTWFLLQCAARVPQRLALTELELATLALASLNAVTYWFWLDKPLQAQEPVKLFLKEIRDQVDGGTDVDDKNEVTVGEVMSRIGEVIHQVGRLFWRFFRNPCKHGLPLAVAFTLVGIPIFLISVVLTLFPIVIAFLLTIFKTEKVFSIEEIRSPQKRRRIASRIVSALRNIRITLANRIHDFFQKRLDEVVRGDLRKFVVGLFIVFPLLLTIFIVLILLLLPLFTLFFLISFLFNSIFGIISTDKIPPRARQVPAFYAPEVVADRYSRMLVFALFGVLIGGLHATAWFFQYPHHFEQTLWRVGSITITAIPLIVAPIDFLLERDENAGSRLPEFLITALDIVMTVLLFIYVPARLSLIAQSIALLRAQPRTAFLAVDWAKFIPHVFSS